MSDTGSRETYSSTFYYTEGGREDKDLGAVFRVFYYFNIVFFQFLRLVIRKYLLPGVIGKIRISWKNNYNYNYNNID